MSVNSVATCWAQPPCAEERNNPLRKVFGNGLRPDIWDEFKQRFDIERICEFYGSSEGNVSFFNALNKDRTMGLTPATIMLVKYDIDADEIVRDAAGKLIEVTKGEAGLLLGEIDSDFKFDGYTSEDATESKILRDVVKPGDAWFNTGDLIRQQDVGFALGKAHYQFVDRVGDTFRWQFRECFNQRSGRDPQWLCTDRNGQCLRCRMCRRQRVKRVW